MNTDGIIWGVPGNYKPHYYKTNMGTSPLVNNHKIPHQTLRRVGGGRKLYAENM